MVLGFCKKTLSCSTLEELPNCFLFSHRENCVRAAVNEWAVLACINFDRGHVPLDFYSRSSLFKRFLSDPHCWLISGLERWSRAMVNLDEAWSLSEIVLFFCLLDYGLWKTHSLGNTTHFVGFRLPRWALIVCLSRGAVAIFHNLI